MNARLPLSILIITLNEEAHLRELLPELDFADEIIIVDSLSTDKTEQVAKSFAKVTFISHPFENFTAQRNFAISKANNDWILFLDADERLTPPLQDEILDVLAHPCPKAAYLFPRKFMFKQEELNFTGWKTDKIYRLFNRKYAKYTEERLVHEKLTVNGKIGKLNNKLIHFSYANFESYRLKMENYGRLKAQEKCAKGFQWTQWKAWLHPNYTFVYHYLIRFGFLDGQKGYIISRLNAYSVNIRYRELKKMQQV
ncbi:MAG: glycosyl transferase [Flavobacterium sp. BFFFF2]|nr:MAG: glycosyl transferase [Flavobacterium sp. BFFFF2]